MPLFETLPVNQLLGLLPFTVFRPASQSSDSLLKFHLPPLFSTQAFHPTKLLHIQSHLGKRYLEDKNQHTSLCHFLVRYFRTVLKVGLQKVDFTSLQFSSVTQSCPTLCDPMNRSTPGLPVYHQLLEFTQTHVHRVGDAIQLSHALLSPSPPAPNPSQHQDLCQ